MSEYGEMCKDMREHRKTVNAERLSRNTRQIDELPSLGFTVELLTSFHFRINGKLDLFPTNRRFHNLQTQQRGRYKYAVDCVREHLGGAE
jgi:hypothetical protein